MESHIENIELIDRYLNKTLSKNEVESFENKLNNDAVFKEVYDTHSIFLEGLKRQTLKDEIKKAKTLHIRNKWFRFLGISIGVLVVSVFVYVNLTNSYHIDNEMIPKEIINKKEVSDSVAHEDVLTKAIIIQDTLKPEIVKVKKLKVVNKVKANKKIPEVKIPKKVAQSFIINIQKDTTIVCKEGTRLMVKANSFVNQNNQIVTGKVDLRITEYYKLSDIILANLTTQSEGKQLETGGMLFIEAKNKNESLKLKENSSIKILFPTKSKKPKMQLFSGAWNAGNINWKIENVEDLDVQEESILVPYAVVEEVPIFPGCENGNREQQRNCTSSEVSKFVQRKFNTEIASALGLTGRQRVNIIFEIDKNGNASNIRSRASDPDLEIEAERVIALLPKMTPGKQRGKTVTVPYSLPITFQVDEDIKALANFSGDLRERKRKLDSIYDKKLEDKLARKNKSVATLSEVNGYILRGSNLGWINCDRFISWSNKIKYKLKVDNGYDTRVNMIFKSINSVMPSRKTGDFYDFGDVPNKEDVILVVIKKEKGKLYLDIVETTTQENPSLEFELRELTIKELKEQLEKLDKMFN